MGIEQQVVFTGRVPHDIVQDYYDLIDILIYPRISMRLTELVTPLKPLEAMAQKKLFIASDVGGHKELVIDKKNGLLFKSGSTTDLAKTVLWLVSQKDQWQLLKDNGRNFVETERNWKTSISRYKPIYQSLIENNCAR